MTTSTAWRTDQPCPVSATGLILHYDGTTPPRGQCRLCALDGRDQGVTRVTSDRGDRQDDPGAADGDAAGREGQDLAVQHGAGPPDPAPAHQPGHRRGGHGARPAGTPSRTSARRCASWLALLRAAQCRKGLHLEDATRHHLDLAMEDQKWWVEKRAEAESSSRTRPQDTGADHHLMKLITELDEEITNAGMRGKAAPDGLVRRHRSTLMPPRTPSAPCPLQGQPAHGRKNKLHRAGRQDLFRPSLFVTLTCPAPTGRASEDDPGRPPHLLLRPAARTR